MGCREGLWLARLVEEAGSDERRATSLPLIVCSPRGSQAVASLDGCRLQTCCAIHIVIHVCAPSLPLCRERRPLTFGVWQRSSNSKPIVCRGWPYTSTGSHFVSDQCAWPHNLGRIEEACRTILRHVFVPGMWTLCMFRFPRHSVPVDCVSPTSG